MGLLEIAGRDYYERGEFHGSYQFSRLSDIINHFMVAYVGEDKIIPKVKKTDVAFHAQRTMQELSFDTFGFNKAQEVTVPPSLKMTLPIDYVNYTKVSWIDSSGIKHLIYPESKTSNPKNFYQNDDGDYIVDPVATMIAGVNVYALDGDYSNILVHGMRVSGLNIPFSPGAVIHGITTTAGITSITLMDTAGLISQGATIGTNQKIRIFRYVGLGQHRLRDNSFAVTGMALTAAIAPGDFEINVTSTADIKKGMYINHRAFVNDITVRDTRGRASSVKVVGVGTGTVQLSHAATYVGLSADPFSFVSFEAESDTWDNYKSGSSSSGSDNEDNTYWTARGERYGLDPQRSQVNGTFYVDSVLGEIHFSSNIAGKTVVVDYISDSLGTDGEMRVHKFAEEAMYKCIIYAILSTRANTQEYIVQRFKKERFAAIRTAKLRLSNIKLEELTQILRGKSKQIKH